MSSKVMLLFGKVQTWIEKNAILYDTFRTAASAPITSPRTAEPGPGLVSATSLVSLGSGWAVLPGNNDLGDPNITLGEDDAGAVARTAGGAGKAALFDHERDGAGIARLGFTNDLSAVAPSWPIWYPYAGAPALAGVRNASGSIYVFETTENQRNKYLIVPRSDTYGHFMVADGILYWVYSDEVVLPLITVRAVAYTTGTTHKLHDLALLPLADYNAKWGGDWTEVTDTDTSPAATDAVDRDAGSCLIECGAITLPSDAMALQIRRVDATNYTTLDINADGSATIKETIAGAEGAALVSIGAGGITDSADLKIQDNAGTVKVFSAGVLAGTATLTDHAEAVLVYVEATGTGGAFTKVETNPYPALGIADSRVVCPQDDDTFTHSADFVAEIKNVQLPAADNLSFQFRISGSDELTLNIATDGSIALLDNATSRISAGAGTVSDDDDIVLVCDGTNGQIFVAGASTGTTSAIAHLTGTSGKRDDATTGTCDHIACFPRDVKSLLPGGTY